MDVGNADGDDGPSNASITVGRDVSLYLLTLTPLVMMFVSLVTVLKEFGTKLVKS